MKGVPCFGVRGKLAPRYVGLFPVTERCGPVAYRVELPPHLSAVHNIFHVCQLRKCLRVPTEWLRWRIYNWSPISSIRSTLSKLLIARLGLLEIKPATSIRCNGVTTPSEKLPGKWRNLSNLNALICYRSIEVYNFRILFNLALAS